MSPQVFRHLLGQAARTTAALSAGTAAFFLLVLTSSASFLSGASVDIPFLREPPRAMRALLGGTADFTQPEGWLVTALNHPITLALFTAAALSVAVGGIAGEVERGTIDFILTHPVARAGYALTVAVAAVVVVTIVEASGMVGVLVARLTVEGMDQIDVSGVFRAFLGSWVLFAAIAALATLVSANARLRGRASAVAVGIVILSFFANVAALLLDSLYPLRRLSLFHYLDSSGLVESAAPLPDLLVLAAVAAGGIALAVVSFARRDVVR